MVEADLDRPDPALAQGEAALRALLRRQELAARCVGEEARRPAAEEPPERRAGGLADEVPDRDLDRPGSAAVQVDRLADLAHDLGAERVEADEQALEQLPVGQAVAARGYAGHALVRAHEHERRVLVSARDGIPRGVEGRVERVAVGACLDGGDAHQSPP